MKYNIEEKETEEYVGVKNKTSSKYLLRQIYISSACWSSFLITGFTYGTPTVMIPQIRKYEPNITITESENILLRSIFGYIAIPWICLLSSVTIIYGRRIPIILVSLATFSGFILLYIAKTVTHIMISQFLQCSAIAATMNICIIVICEYAAPKYRGVMLTIKLAMGYWGLWIANAVGAFLSWRNIALLGIACSIFMLPIIFFPESPSWLASKGRFDECRKAHRWLRGKDEDSERELEKMIKSQQEYLRQKKKKSRSSLIEIKKMVKSGEFYKPLFLAILLCFMHFCSGKFVCTMYSIDIIKMVTDSDKMAVIGMLIMDGITVFGMYTGSFVSVFVSRRGLLFTSNFATIILLFILSLYLYLTKLSFITENHFISLTLLGFFSISVSSGIILMASTIFGEIVCLKYRSVSMLTISVCFYLISSLVLQSSPYLFKYIGLHGAFFVYAISSSIFTAICYKYLPETKNKTLLEIEEYFKDVRDKKRIDSDVNDILMPDTVN